MSNTALWQSLPLLYRYCPQYGSVFNYYKFPSHLIIHVLGNYFARLASSGRVERTAAPPCKMIIPMPSPLHDFLPQFPWQSDRDFCLPSSHGHNEQLVHRACIGVYRPIATASCCRSWFMPHCLLAHGSGRTIPIVWIHPSLIYPFFSLVAVTFSTSP